MKKKCDEYKSNISRLKGQLDGILVMIENNRDSVEIVNQIKAVRSGLATLAIDILSDEASNCLSRSKKDKVKTFEELLKVFFSVK
ncbi:MAG: hypothetical protein KatS3mg086_138 [Candidatus Dojkabacteria bacterium]|nr:MAG: hypothetical protein KatS3mg086_138 [Candidatus Dojkabacteria bacterium]